MHTDKKSNFEELFQRDGFASIHHQNVNTFLAFEKFKVLKVIDPQVLKEVFQFRDAAPHQLRKQTDFQMFSVA